MPSVVRQLRQDDLPDLLALSTAAGWNQTLADWQRLLDLEPLGCFGIELDSHIVASTTAVRYGQRAAWIGMVLTHPQDRRRGLARQLMEHALAWLEQQGIEWIGLDATEMGEPLYRALGFEPAEPIERWAGQPERPPAAGTLPAGYDPVLDAKAYGLDRRPLLDRLAGEGSVQLPGRGFAMWRAGREAWMFGPCIAVDPDTLQALLACCLAQQPGQLWFWDLLPANSLAVEIARQGGFQLRRRLVRMWRAGCPGKPRPQFRTELIWATAGFEYG